MCDTKKDLESPRIPDICKCTSILFVKTKLILFNLKKVVRVLIVHRSSLVWSDLVWFSLVFHLISSILSTFIHFHPFSLTLTHFHPLLPTFIHFNSLSSTFIHFHPLSFTFIHFHPLSSTSIHFHPL